MSPERQEFALNLFGRQHGSPRYKAWENWLAEHGFPIAQVPVVDGWAERDVEARTVSARVFAWRPGDEERFGERSIVYPGFRARPLIAYSYEDATLRPDPDPDERDAWMGVLTIQLDREPAPFPGVE